jgi:hypothetical protein
MTAALRNTQATPNLRPLGVALAGLLGAGALLAGLAGAQTATSPKAAPLANAAPVWDHGTSSAALETAPVWDHGTSLITEVTPALVFDHGTSLITEPKAGTWQNGVNSFTGFTAPKVTPQATWDHGTSSAGGQRSGGASRLGFR